MNLTEKPSPEDFTPLLTHGIQFATVVELGDDYEVYDFTSGYDANRVLASPYGVGRYDEHRPGMYEGEQFQEVGSRQLFVSRYERPRLM